VGWAGGGASRSEVGEFWKRTRQALLKRPVILIREGVKYQLIITSREGIVGGDSEGSAELKG